MLHMGSDSWKFFLGDNILLRVVLLYVFVVLLGLSCVVCTSSSSKAHKNKHVTAAASLDANVSIGSSSALPEAVAPRRRYHSDRGIGGAL